MFRDGTSGQATHVEKAASLEQGLSPPIWQL
jgi:hypothetical protein